MNRLLTDIFSGIFLIPPSYGRAYFPIIENMLKGVSVDEDIAKKERERLSAYNVSSTKSSGKTNDYVLVVPIEGAITKADQFCGPKGTKTLTNIVKEADADPLCQCILFQVDSPGGQVSYTDILANTIKEVKTPTISFIEGMAASAAYWIVSQTDEIYVSSPNDEVGSIGAYMSFLDAIPYYEKKGYNLVEVYAPQSKDKNKIFRDALNGDTTEYAEKVLKPIVEQFIASVKNRASVVDAEGVFSGAMFRADKAIENGLIDGIKSFDEVMEIALSKGNKNNMANTTEKKYQQVTSLVGFDNEEIILTDGHASISETVLDTIEDRLQEIDDISAANDGLNDEKDALKNELAQLKTEFENYKKSKGAGDTTGKKGGDSFNNKDVDVNAFAHNKIADNL